MFNNPKQDLVNMKITNKIWINSIRVLKILSGSEIMMDGLMDKRTDRQTDRMTDNPNPI